MPAHPEPSVDALKGGIIMPEIDSLPRVLEDLDLLDAVHLLVAWKLCAQLQESGL